MVDKKSLDKYIMSIVTLKKKVGSQYDNMSVNRIGGFSLNGTRRNQGYVGQTMLSRSLPRTLMKGNVIKGHGGCCGKYPVYPIVQSGVNYLNDPSVVKPSVMNTKEMIETKYFCVPPDKCPINGRMNNTVKPDVNNNNNTQEYYIEKLSKEAKCTDAEKNTVKIIKYIGKNKKCKPCYIIIDPIKIEKLSLSQSDYIKKIASKCNVLDKDKFIKKNTQHTPFACGIPPPSKK